MFKLHEIFVAVQGLSPVAVSKSSSPLRSPGFTLPWLPLLWCMGSRSVGFSSCSTQARELWLLGFAAHLHAESSQTRDQTHVPRIGRQILIHCITREVPEKELLPRAQWSHTNRQAPPTNPL